ncbi:MAG TPA: GspH/FimT family pseudopilin [Candidatus Binatia bacterium]|nr:GspH/FimT family pseudopilin [Candidatus Binatia bacterium]
MNARGFALVELMVILAIAGILAALVAPTLSGYARTSALQAAARELATSINLGRQIAISQNTTVCVEVATVTSIRLRTGGCGGTIWTGPGTDGSGAIRISDPSALHLSTTGNVVFTSLGAASPAGTYTLTNPVNNGTRTVVVAATGRVSVR